MTEQLKDTRIKLKKLFVEAKLPAELAPLKELAQNIWWSWDAAAIELFKFIDPHNWEASRYNPIILLNNIDARRAKMLIEDKVFMKSLKNIYKRFQIYLAEKPAKNAPLIAYFCMEYGLHISLRLYSGGLGILAGDFLKEASDRNVHLIGVGLLYRYGYFQQSLSLHGDQIANYPAQKFTELPLEPVKNEQGERIKIQIALPGRPVFAQIWDLKVGRISLYLLDTDIEQNSQEDRALTYHLYGGDNEHRLKQEILLGIGGVRALKAISLQPDIFHSNEGHAAFFGLERLNDLINEENLDYSEAIEVVRSSSLFTTHTPVPAGHDHFHESLLRNYIGEYANRLKIDWPSLMALGKIHKSNLHEEFSMSHLAVRLCREVGGVSKLHGTVSQKMFNVLYPGFNHEELHISYVTNSVHYPTWIAKEWQELHLKTFGKNFLEDQTNKEHWKKIYEVPDKTIVTIRQQLKSRLIEHIKIQLQQDLRRRGESPGSILKTINAIPKQALMIGFARRFATYKRAHLLFSDLERLSKIVDRPDQPVVFVFSGKAHPADGGGQDLIRHIIKITKQPGFLGKVIFLENYNTEIAKLLVQGVDVWLNTPIRPKEASGTSGMKAAMNGVMSFSVLDGWWAEGYRADAGWALPIKRTYQEQHLQNELDAEIIYHTLENDIIPTYYAKDKNGISKKWVAFIKTIIAEVAPDFTMKRMMDDYQERFYQKLDKSRVIFKANNYQKAKILAEWKKRIIANWEAVEVADKNIFDSVNKSLEMGERFNAAITLNLGELTTADIGIEIVFFKKRITDDELELSHKEEMQLTQSYGNKALFKTSIKTSHTGVYNYGFRIFPKHPLLPHLQDFGLVKWV